MLLLNQILNAESAWRFEKVIVEFWSNITSSMQAEVFSKLDSYFDRVSHNTLKKYRKG